jgi:hypothetical protein
VLQVFTIELHAVVILDLRFHVAEVGRTLRAFFLLHGAVILRILRLDVVFLRFRFDASGGLELSTGSLAGPTLLLRWRVLNHNTTLAVGCIILLVLLL